MMAFFQLGVDAAGGRASVSWAQRLDGLAYAGLLGLLVWAPWPLGSNRAWAVAVLAAAVWILLVLAHLAASLQAPAQQRAPVRWSLLPFSLLAGFALLVACQLWPGLGDGGGTISIEPFDTRLYLLTTLVYFGSWWLVRLTVRTRERSDRLLAVIVAAGVLQALAAVGLHTVGARYEYLHTAFVQGGRAMGTFPNPDHLAGYMELCLSAGLGWLLPRMATDGQARSVHWRARAVRVLAFVMSGKMLLRLLLVVMVIALVMSHSRMGNGAFFLSIALTGAIVAGASRRLRRPALWLVASMVLVDVLIVGQWVGLDRVMERLEHTAEASSGMVAGFGLGAVPPPQEESLEKRMQVPRLSLRLVADRPWFGHGGGTYYTAFPPYKVPGIPWHWDHAHNDYVQVACDTGWVGLTLWLLVGVASLARALFLLRAAHQEAQLGVAVAALMAICCMGLHSIVDFNLCIPSNALTFTVLLSAVWSIRSAGKSRRSRKPVSAA